MIPVNIPFKDEIERHRRLTGHTRFQILGLKKGKVKVLHCKQCEGVRQ